MEEAGKPEIIAYHGWGFDSGFWEPWGKLLGGVAVFHTADRGYFGNSLIPEFSTSPNSKKILFLHSFGLHWCDKKQFAACDLAVIFNGFTSFHPEEEKHRKRSVRVLDGMIRGFEQKPEEVLKKFHSNCYWPDENNKENTGFSEMNKDLLMEDLKDLGISQFETNEFRETPSFRILALDGGKDKILPQKAGKAISLLSDAEGVYHIINEAGHAMPVTHTSDCWSFINAMIPIFRHHEFN